jgi:DNA-directed RNA polymerase specialized sigma24 family protein
MPDNKQFVIRVNGQRVPVGEEIFMAYHRSKRRDRYYERDIKTENPIRDEDGNLIGLAPSKEDSLERLRSVGADFADDGEPVEDAAVLLLMTDKLHTAIALLTPEERALIDALFFSNCGRGMSERRYADMYGVPRKTVAYQKSKILLKLHKLLKS